MTRRLPAIALGVAALLALAPATTAQDGAAGDAPAEAFALRNAVGARWSRVATSWVRLRQGPASHPDVTIDVRRTVQTELRVITLSGSRLAVWDEVCSHAETLAGQMATPREEHLRTTDPIAGTTIRYRRVGNGFEGSRMRGSDTPLLRAYLSVPHASGLRERLLPAKRMRVREEVTITEGGPDTVAFVAPVLAEPKGPLVLRLETILDTAGPRVARLRGSQRLEVRQRAPGIGDAIFETDARVALDFDVVGGHVRAWSIRGEETTTVRRGEETLPFAVSFEIKEKIVRLPDAEPGSEGPETLEPVFDDREWTVGHEEAKGDHSIVEWVTDGETAHDWTELVTVHTYPRGPKWDGDELKRLLAALQARQRSVEPKCVWSVIEERDGELVYEWTLEDGRQFPDQHELGRLVRGTDRLLQIRYTRNTESKRGPLSEKARTLWLRRLRQARRVGGTAASAAPVPPPSPGAIETIVPLFDERDWQFVATEDRGPGKTRTDYRIKGDDTGQELVSVLTRPRAAGKSLSVYFAQYSTVRRVVVKGTTFTKLSETDREIVYESKRPASELGVAGHELGRVVLGQSQFLHVRYIAKTPELSADARRAWLVRVRRARVAPVE